MCALDDTGEIRRGKSINPEKGKRKKSGMQQKVDWELPRNPGRLLQIEVVGSKKKIVACKAKEILEKKLKKYSYFGREGTSFRQK